MENIGVKGNQTKGSEVNNVASDLVTKRVEKLEVTAGIVEKLERELRNSSEVANETKNQLTKLRETFGDSLSKSEDKLSREAKNNISFFEKELAKTSTTANNTKQSLADLERKVDRLGN